MKVAIINRKGESACFLDLCELFEKADWKKVELFCQEISLVARESTKKLLLQKQYMFTIF